MPALIRHPLVRADLRDAYNWYEDLQPGLGLEFATDFLSHYRLLVRDAQLYAVRFADVRRLNFDRFPYTFSTSSGHGKSGCSPCFTPAATPKQSSPNGGGISVTKLAEPTFRAEIRRRGESDEGGSRITLLISDFRL
jgi:hypothetical protein